MHNILFITTNGYR